MEFFQQLPLMVPFHGELCTEDDDLRCVKETARLKIPRPRKWNKLKIMVFAIKPYSTFFKIDEYMETYPLEELTREPFYANKRYTETLTEAKKLAEPNDCFDFIEHHKINSKQQALEAINIFDLENWEGLVFFDLNSRYSNTRAKDVLKYKPDYEDEATIIGFTDGKNRHLGAMGGIEVEFTWDEKVINIHGGKPEFVGRTINMVIGGGFTDIERDWGVVENKFIKGQKIPFSFKLISADGVPQHCNYYKGK